jgi:uncharacterized protein
VSLRETDFSRNLRTRHRSWCCAFAASRNTKTAQNIIGLILETAFTSVADVLRTLYPQRWLPYRYLTPFLRSSWNMREYVPEIVKRTKAPRIMMVQAENDEVVSNTMAPEIKEIATSNKSEVDFRIVEGALHFDA